MFGFRGASGQQSSGTRDSAAEAGRVNGELRGVWRGAVRPACLTGRRMGKAVGRAHLARPVECRSHKFLLAPDEAGE